MVITVPLENIKKLLENGYEGTWLALEEKDGSSICSNLPGELDTGEKWEESEQIVKMDNRYYTVSYTHLDVYKRQVPI